GKLNIKNADLKAITDIALSSPSPGTLLSPSPGTPGEGRGEGTGQIKSGNLSGTLELVRAEKGQTLFVGDLAATNLTITDPQNLIRNEKLSLSLRASANDKFSLIDLRQLDLKSSFMNLLFSETIIHRPVAGAAVPPLEMFEKARMAM